jgi:biotin carboxyl carrier protein
MAALPSFANCQAEAQMLPVRVSENLWATSLLPDGEFERWRALDGQTVEAGQAVAEVRIEGALHEIPAPGRGILIVSAHTGDVVQPGDRLGWVEAASR